MNRWIRRTLTCASIASALAIVPAGLALAQQTAATGQDGHDGKHGHGHREGLVEQALKLDSLSAEQRSAIDALIQQRRAAEVPVRSADAQVLTTLAQQVEQAAISAQALAPSLNAENSAAAAESAVERDILSRLHAVLTPAQRSQIVDQIEAAHSHHGDGGGQGEADERRGGRRGWGDKMAKLALTPEQKAQFFANLRAERGPDAVDGGKSSQRGERREALETFRGDSFDASALVHVERRGEHAEKIAKAMVPVLTAAQRATLASELRSRAAHESGS